MPDVGRHTINQGPYAATHKNRDKGERTITCGVRQKREPLPERQPPGLIVRYRMSIEASGSGMEGRRRWRRLIAHVRRTHGRIAQVQVLDLREISEV